MVDDDTRDRRHEFVSSACFCLLIAASGCLWFVPHALALHTYNENLVIHKNLGISIVMGRNTSMVVSTVCIRVWACAGYGMAYCTTLCEGLGERPGGEQLEPGVSAHRTNEDAHR